MLLQALGCCRALTVRQCASVPGQCCVHARAHRLVSEDGGEGLVLPIETEAHLHAQHVRGACAVRVQCMNSA